MYLLDNMLRKLINIVVMINIMSNSNNLIIKFTLIQFSSHRSPSHPTSDNISSYQSIYLAIIWLWSRWGFWLGLGVLWGLFSLGDVVPEVLGQRLVSFCSDIFNILIYDVLINFYDIFDN